MAGEHGGENVVDYLLGYPVYHTRYTELSRRILKPIRAIRTAAPGRDITPCL